jgi:hypothetical protein
MYEYKVRAKSGKKSDIGLDAFIFDYMSYCELDIMLVNKGKTYRTLI